MPTAPNFSESADWMTQYMYLPRAESLAAIFAASVVAAAVFSRGARATALTAGALRRAGRLSFVLMDVFLAIGGLYPGAPAPRGRLAYSRAQLGAQRLILGGELVVR